MTADEIKQAVLDALNDHPSFDAEMHMEHHQWIKERIEAEKRKKELYMAAAKSFAQWSVVGIAGAFWVYFKQHWH
jgi:hypothetical protein